LIPRYATLEVGIHTMELLDQPLRSVDPPDDAVNAMASEMATRPEAAAPLACELFEKM
jgi:hypothetical protein